MTSRRDLLKTATVAPALAAAAESRITKYVRYRAGSAAAAYGILEGETVRAITGPLFGEHKPNGAEHKLAGVKLLYPCQPPKIFAVGLNYKSHIGKQTPPANPEIFYKPITCLQNPGDPIRIPKTALNVHYEGEMAIVIGRRTRNVSAGEAPQSIFGVTCGIDVSERDWQNGPQKDLQWWRAKGADTFGPLGPCIARGLDYGNLKLQTRLNGKVVQQQSTSDLLFPPAAIVSWISQAVTLTPGDVIYTGTPGQTGKMQPGDVVEVEIEGIGVLRNPVAAA
ncbi:MAG: fumarylacetoacetate hydrolase family protein [Acidobacteria bacterium]|nr:fumarylacetoacetate hydrolase family protein [Acidobacteriota bacterium]